MIVTDIDVLEHDLKTACIISYLNITDIFNWTLTQQIRNNVTKKSE